MRTKLSLLVKLRIEVKTTKKTKSKIITYYVFGRIVKALLFLIKITGKLSKMIGLNR